jgi:addiction module HigA family antidote
MILEEFVKPLDVTLEEVAKQLKIRHQHLREIIHEKRGVTADVALRLERLFGLEAQAWLNLQMAWDLFHAQRSESAKAIRRIRRLPALRRAS